MAKKRNTRELRWSTAGPTFSVLSRDKKLGRAVCVCMNVMAKREEEENADGKEDLCRNKLFK